MNLSLFKYLATILFYFVSFYGIQAQHVSVGNGGYTTAFPGVDAAGRNGYPAGNPILSGNALNKPIPTNDWWSAKLQNNHVDNLFSYPYAMRTLNSGLATTYIPWGVLDNINPLILGVSGLNASQATVADYSDWMVKFEWKNSTHRFSANMGIGMPFIYFEKDSQDVASVVVNQGIVTIQNEILTVENARNGADFAIYAPTGSSWTQSGNVYTSTLNGKNYWSMAFLPLTTTNVSTAASTFQEYAYVFPTQTEVNWSYNQQSSKVKTDFKVYTDVKEGLDTNVLLGLLPHQWANLDATSPAPSPTSFTYDIVRGELKTLASNHFTVSNTFHGILPTLPYLNQYSQGFNPSDLDNKISALENDQLNPWTDSYNEGQMMNRLIQSARIAEMMKDTTAVKSIVKTVKGRLEDWLKSEAGEVAFLFYYRQNWTALLGYPAGHGQDNNLNDHHFHWGYFIHAAAFMEQYEPGWANQWGDMVNLLVRDASSYLRNDSLFPFLRNFSPYAGHCWANGFASFPQGNDQESTSESMQFHSSLIHWGSITNNAAIRDLGIYLYTTEQSAIEEYWFDQNNRIFKPTQQYSLVSRVWGNSYDNGTFWTSDIAASYGIELYPMHGGSLYLGHDTVYANKLWSEIENNTGILAHQANPNLWHDIMYQYLALTNPQKAIQLYNANSNRALKFGVSDAQTYHWIHAMNALGIVDISITADDPMAVVFNKQGQKTYVAHNYTNSSKTFAFSDGTTLTVGPNKMGTSRDINIEGQLTSNFQAVFPGGSNQFTFTPTFGNPSKVGLYQGDSLVEIDSVAPFDFTVNNIQTGHHKFYARVYLGNLYNFSNIVTLIAGDQLPYPSTVHNIPGTIEAGNYDSFEGGLGEGISYHDADALNQGTYRPNEGVDAGIVPNEGATVGWTNSGEWLEYSVNVQTPGLYNLTLRYASGNTAGGGPVHLMLDGDTIKSIFQFNSTNGWNNWQSKIVNAVPLKGGNSMLRVAFEQGEINLGRMTFSYSGALPYSQPVANAGQTQIIQLPTDTTILDGSLSIDPNSNPLNYSWTQLYGPSVLTFDSANSSTTVLRGLIEGIYRLKLTVDNGGYSDSDELYVISSTNNNVPPNVSLINPQNGDRFLEQQSVIFEANASDLNGNVQKVDFYVDGIYEGTDFIPPYQWSWNATLGPHQVMASAIDNQNDTAYSVPKSITVDPAPPCRDTSSNGDFLYEFSNSLNNPTITFIPTVAGMGSPTCILYYGTSPTGPYPGYGVSPNVPFQITAAQGTQIYFYYTYDYPGQGQRNNGANPDTYTIGTCSNVSTSIEMAKNAFKKTIVYPNPVNDHLNLQYQELPFLVRILDINAKLIKSHTPVRLNDQVDFSNYSNGLYFIEVISKNGTERIKLIK